MREYVIYNKNDWTKGEFFGSYATNENNLVNGFKELNNYDFQNPLISKFEHKTTTEYSKIETANEENTIKLVVNKKDDDQPSDQEYYCKSFTKLFTEGLLEENSKVFTILFDWSSYKTQFEETGRIILKSKVGPSYELILNNRSEIKIKTFSGSSITEELVEDSGPNSIGDISSFISNDLHNCYLDVQISDNKIYSRIRISGYESKWFYSDFFADGIDSIEFVLDNKTGTNSFVDKTLKIKNIYIDGFHNGLSYESKVFDTYETGSVLESIGVSGFFTRNALVGFEKEENMMMFRIFAAETIENLSDYEKHTKVDVMISVNDFENNNFNFTKNIENIKGRYIKVFAYTSLSHYYQNEINFIRLKYIPGSEIDKENIQTVEEVEVSKEIGPEGGIIETDTEKFNTVMYIPPGALENLTMITIKRLSSEDEIVAGDMIGFDIEPKKLEFKKPALLEVDYAGFNFNRYQSEEGFKLAYLQELYEPEEIDTVISKNLKKAIAYIYKL